MVTLDYSDIDERYIALEGLNVTEYAVQSQSGVFDTLKNLKDYNTVNAEKHVKMVNKMISIYQFFYRPTVNFEFACEMNQGKTVSDYVNLLE